MRLVCLSLVATGLLGAVAAGQVAVGGAPPGQGAARGGAIPGTTTGSRTGIVMGQVVDGSTGRPISDAIVSISTGGGARGAGLAVAPPGRAGGPVPPQRVLVDGQGRFLFRDLPAGPVTLQASKPGYFGGASGQQTPRGQARPIDLADAERMGGVTLRLWAYGIVSGTVLDEAGVPVTGVSVQLIKRTAANGRWQYASNLSAITDDRGAYRFGSVLPGDYLVGMRSDGGVDERLIVSLALSDEAAVVKMLPKLMERGEESMLIDASVRMYPATFFPGSTQASDAAVISVESGAERARVDFKVKAVPARKVAGSVTGPGLQPDGGSVVVRLKGTESGSPEPDINAPTASMQPNGRFVFTAVPAGRYILEAVSRPRVQNDAASGGRGVPAGRGALPPAPEAPTLYAAIPVTVGEQNISDLDVTLAPSGRVTGRVEFDGADRPTDEVLNQISVTLEPLDTMINGSLRPGRVEADGTFRTSSVPPGRYLLRVGSLSISAAGAPPPGSGAASPGAGAISGGGIPGQPRVWRPRSAIINGVDPLDQPLDIGPGDVTSVLVTFSDKAQIVFSGTVRDVKGDGDPQAVVLVFPTDTRLWSDLTGASRRVKVTRTSRYGAYSIAGLPAGEYFVAVGNDDQFVDMQAPGALQSYIRLATRVVLVEGQTKTLDLKSGGK